MSVAFDLDVLTAPGPVPARRPGLRVVARGPAAASQPHAWRPEPQPAQTWQPAGDMRASVSVLHAPSASAVAAPLRLTRRGVAALAVLTAAAGAGLVWAATLSAPDAMAGPVDTAPATVTVRPGDTLWALASRVAPQRDPRAEVADLRRRNHLADSALTPGQVLRVR